MTRRLPLIVLATSCVAYAQPGVPSRSGAPADARPVADAPDPADLLREGTAAAEAGKLGDSLELLRRAADGTADDAVRRRALFNLGSVLLRRGREALAEHDVPRALAALRLAEQRYLACVELDHDDLEAARNVEHVRGMIRDIRAQEQTQGQDRQDDQQQPNEQSQGNQGEQGQNGQQDQQGRQERQAQDQQGQDGSDETGQSADRPPSPTERLEDLAQQQAQLNADTRERGSQRAEESASEQQDLRERTQQEASATDNQEIADSLRQAGEEQQAAEDALRRGDMREADGHQQAASEALERAYERSVEDLLEQMLASGPTPEQAEDAGAESRQGQSQTDPIVQALIDREQEQRDARRRQGLMRSIPERVEKDW